MKLFTSITAALILAPLMLFTGRTANAADAGSDAAIHPYIDEGTFFVMRIDLDRVDPAALEKLMNDMMESRGQNAQISEDMKKRAAEDIEKAKTWITDMNAAGGKRMYVLVDQTDQQGGPGDGPIMVVPLAEGADKAKIEETLAKTDGGGHFQVQEIGKGMALGSEKALGRLKTVVDTGKSVQRTDLAPAMAAAMKSVKDGPMWIAYVPGESTRAFIDENLPALPPQLGGGETKILSRGVKYIAAGVSQKPGVIAHLTIRAENAENAKSIHDVLTKGVAFAKEATAATALKDEAAKKIESMKLKLDGDTITLAVDPIFAQSAMMAVVMQGMGQRGAPPAAAPAKPDDGGL